MFFDSRPSSKAGEPRTLTNYPQSGEALLLTISGLHRYMHWMAIRDNEDGTYHREGIIRWNWHHDLFGQSPDIFVRGPRFVPPADAVQTIWLV